MASISKATPPKPVASWASLGPQDARITLSGRISADSLGLIWQQIRTQQNEWLASHSKVKALVLDGSQIEYLDGAGLAFMIDLCHAQEAASVSIKLEGFKPSYQTQLKRFTPFEKMFPKAYSGSTDSFIIRTGKAASIFWNDIKSIIFLQGR